MGRRTVLKSKVCFPRIHAVTIEGGYGRQPTQAGAPQMPRWEGSGQLWRLAFIAIGFLLNSSSPSSPTLPDL